MSSLTDKIKQVTAGPAPVGSIAAAPKSSALGYTFVCHPYTFRVGDKEFKPDEDGFYHPETAIEVKEFEHFVAKGFAQKK